MLLNNRLSLLQASTGRSRRQEMEQGCVVRMASELRRFCIVRPHLLELSLGCCELVFQLCNVPKVCILPLCKVFFSVAVQLLQKLNTLQQELRGGISCTCGRHLHSSPDFISGLGQPRRVTKETIPTVTIAWSFSIVSARPSNSASDTLLSFPPATHVTVRHNQT